MENNKIKIDEISFSGRTLFSEKFEPVKLTQKESKQLEFSWLESMDTENPMSITQWIVNDTETRFVESVLNTLIPDYNKDKVSIIYPDKSIHRVDFFLFYDEKQLGRVIGNIVFQGSQPSINFSFTHSHPAQ